MLALDPNRKVISGSSTGRKLPFIEEAQGRRFLASPGAPCYVLYPIEFGSVSLPARPLFFSPREQSLLASRKSIYGRHPLIRSNPF